MIFVSVGTAKQSFRRLLDEVERLARAGVFGSRPVMVQSGYTTDFVTEACKVVPFLPPADFELYLEKADLVICQGGSTVLAVLRLGKTPVVMPRMRGYGEHVNDHQVQFVRAVAAEGWVIPAYEASDLGPAVERALRAPRTPADLPPSRMAELVEHAIEELTASRLASTRRRLGLGRV